MAHASDYQTEAYQLADARHGSKKLLGRLREYHGIIDIVEEFEEAKPPKPAPKVVHISEPIALCDNCRDPLFKISGVTRIQDVKRLVSKYLGLAVSDIDSYRRTAKIVYGRQLCMYLARTRTHKSYPEIGRRLGGRDHTTVLYGVGKIEGLVQSDWTIAYDVAHLEGQL